MRALLPTLRERKRYIAYQVEPAKNPDEELLLKGDELRKEIVLEINKRLGVFDGADAGIKNIMIDPKVEESIKKNDLEKGVNREVGIIKVNHKMVDKVRIAMMLITKIRGQPVRIMSLGTSGILKKCSRFF